MSITNLTDSDKQRLSITLLTESKLHFKLLNNYDVEIPLKVEYLDRDEDLIITIDNSGTDWNSVLLNKKQIDVLKRFLLRL